MFSRTPTSPKILLSYAASQRLGIVKFQIPNEVPSTALDTISSEKTCHIQDTTSHIQTNQTKEQWTITIETSH